MGISAGLDWVGNLAPGANSAADAVDRLAASLRALQAIQGSSSGMPVTLPGGGGAAGGIKGAANEANKAALLQAKHAADLAKIEAQRAAQLDIINAKQSAGAAAGDVAQQLVAARAAAAIQQQQARAATDAQRANLAAQASQQKAIQAVIVNQAKTADSAYLSQIKGAQAQQAAAEKAALVERKGAVDAALVREKSAASLAKIEAKSAADLAKIAAQNAAQGSGGGRSSVDIKGAAGDIGKASAAWNLVASIAKDAAYALVRALGNAVVSGAQMAVDAAEFKNNMLVGLDKMLGGAEASKAAYKQIQTIANVTPFETQDVAIFYRTLAGGLGDVKKTELALKAVADVAALNDFDTDKAKRLSDAIAKMAGSGKLSIETLNQLGDASGGVIGRGDIFDAVAAMTGQARGGIQKQIEQGKIDATKGLDAILSVVKKKVSGGELGSLAKTLGESSVTGLLSTIKGVGTSLLEDVNIQPVIKGLKTISDAIQGPAGERLKGSVERFFSNIFEAIFGPLGDEQGPDRVVKVIDRISGVIDKAAVAIKDATPTIQAFSAAMLALTGGDTSGLDGGAKKFAAAIKLYSTGVQFMLSIYGIGKGGPGGLIQPLLDLLGVDADVGQLGKWVDALYELANPFILFRSILDGITGGEGLSNNPIVAWVTGMGAGLGDAITSTFSGLGSNIIDGLVGGIAGGAARVVDAVKGVASSAIDTAKSVLGIRSPSREFQTIGMFSALGMQRGFEDNAANVSASAAMMASDAALSASLAMPMMTGGGAAMGAGAGTRVVNLVLPPGPLVVVQAAAGDDAEALAEKLDPIIRRKMIEILRQIPAEV